MEQLEQTRETEDKQSRLKMLIAKGKEQGYLTYHEVNDHLPDDIVDPEQIEDIINMINDMGIKVHETAPDQDILMTDSTDGPDEDAAAEAAAALVSVENEFGRTTDPVRMYMREMGTVDLLTREGEIRIAKRIERGINQVLIALTHYPVTIEWLLASYADVESEVGKLSDIIVGFTDKEEYPDAGIPPVVNVAKASDSDDDDDDEPTGPDPEEVRAHIKAIDDSYQKFLKAIKRYGKDHKKTAALQAEMTERFMDLKLAPKFIDKLTIGVRILIDQIRRTERDIMKLCVKEAKMPRKDFISSFPGNEINPDWIV